VAFCVLGIALWKSIVYLMEFVYDVLNKNRIIYMKIMLPRADSKADREVAKELAKDMKEKI
jgi:flagellar basal body-associated protein FliL